MQYWPTAAVSMATLWPPNTTAPVTLENQWREARDILTRGEGGWEAKWPEILWLTHNDRRGQQRRPSKHVGSKQALQACGAPHEVDCGPAGLGVTLPKLTFSHIRNVIFPVPDEKYDPPLPFSSLLHLNLANNVIFEEDGLLALASWPVLRELVIWGNPLTTAFKGDPPILSYHLGRLRGVRIFRCVTTLDTATRIVPEFLTFTQLAKQMLLSFE